MAAKSNKQTKPTNGKIDPPGEKSEKPSPKSKKQMEDDEDDEDLEDEELDLKPSKKPARASAKKAADEDDDDDLEADDEADDWEKGEVEEEEWDPDFDEFDIPKSTGKKIGGKKGADEDEDFKLDDDMKEFDLFNDSEFDDDEEAFAAAKREFMEETGVDLPEGDFMELGTVKYSSGKVVHAWAVEDDLDPDSLVSNTFTIEWPPKSGQQQAFPELDKFAWFTLSTAKQKLTKAQMAFIDRLAENLGVEVAADGSSVETGNDRSNPEQVSLL